MEAKLKSLLKNPRSILLFKAVLFGVLLAFAKGWAIPAAIFFYAKPVFNTFSFLCSFLLLMVLSLSLINTVSGGWFFVLASGGLAFIFYLILGMKNLVFVRRNRWNYVLHILLFYSTFVLFFLSDKSDLFFLKSLGVFAVAVLLFREFLKTAAENFPNLRGLFSWTLALLVWQAIWAIGLLPIGFLNSANLATLLVFVIGDLAINHFKNALNRQLIYSELSLFAVLALLILATSRWSL